MKSPFSIKVCGAEGNIICRKQTSAGQRDKGEARCVRSVATIRGLVPSWVEQIEMGLQREGLGAIVPVIEGVA